jgi:hypothetical protein
VQQPKDLKVSFVLDFGLGVQARYRSTGTGEKPAALCYCPKGSGRSSLNDISAIAQQSHDLFC